MTLWEPNLRQLRAFEVTASLYSVQQHKTVATMQMIYKGQSIEEAWQRFTTR